MAKERLQARADKDTIEALEQYLDDESTIHDTRSEAVRHFVRRELAERDYPVAAPDGGGVVTERVAQLEEVRDLQSMVILVSLGWIGATVSLDLSGVPWLLSGLALILVSLTLIYVRSRGGI